MKKKPAINNYSGGFTLVELMVVLAMVAVIVSFSSINLTSLIATTSFDDSLELLVSDIKRQQLRSMAGEEQENSSTFGVHFDTDQYVLFVGNTYAPSATTNIVVKLPEGLAFESNQFPGGNIIFIPPSGSVINYSTTTDRITIRHSGSNNTAQLEVNALGVIEIL